ncbi:MAG: beta-propeller fold lactonase family protein [Puniceicoccales bacterium]|nr:beta-propeller fold lactonase family protein [Puniceicoccales bacterium]
MTTAPIHAADAKAPYLSPEAISVDAARQIAYTALTTAKSVAVTDLKTGTVTRLALAANPNDLLLSPDGKTLFVSVGNARGQVEIFDTTTAKRKAALAAGHTPFGLALSPDGKTLYVANRHDTAVAVYDLAQGKAVASIPVVREPRHLCLTPDGKTLAVGNYLPAQAATDPAIASAVTLIDTAKRAVRATVVLETGSQSLHGLAVSPDGKFLYGVHILSRFGVPVTQLTRGWVNTAALCIIDIEKATIFATVLLDDPDNGAANPAGIALGDKGRKLYIALAGTHELLTLELGRMTALLNDFFAGKAKIPYVKEKFDLSYSLSFTAPFKKRIPLKGRSPRSVVILEDSAPEGSTDEAPAAGTVLVSSRFATALEKVAFTGGRNPRVAITPIVIGTEPAPDAVRRGELNFGDASVCYQQWQSCVSCHPDDGRADGLNWDQQNDGLGNPKNTKSMLFAHVTPPCMITGIRKDAELAVRRGILHTLETRQPESFAADIDAYLKSLRPLESPFLAEYRAKDPTGKGKKLFESAGCADCHSGPLLTDREMHDVGTGIEDDKGRKFDTPTLCEIWRTAPYLYDGRAVTIRDVLTTHNKTDAHGSTQKLTKEEIDALALYVLTL